MKALILAAGFGTRLRPHSEKRPKPLFTVAGRSLLDRIIDALERAGCTAVAVNTHHLAGQIHRHLADGRHGIPVEIRHEPEILGTGGAIAGLRGIWDREPFLVINSDIVTDIDLAEIYRVHRDRKAPVTLVLVDDPALNSVRVDARGQVTGFCRAGEDGPEGRLLTFTGIQVIDPEVLDFFPPGVFSSSIDAFQRMLAAGRKIRAEVVSGAFWQDVGTPERFRAVARQLAGGEGFRQAFGNPPGPDARWQRLCGDGSDRRWHRLVSRGRSVVLADHGIADTPGTAEVDAFVSIGTHLYEKGVPVPRIFCHDRFSGMVCLEDLGDILLQDRVRQIGTEDGLFDLYRPVVGMLADMSRRGAEGFDPAWTHQRPAYDRETIVEAECRYFIDAFCNGYLNLGLDFEPFAEEFEFLADQALSLAVTGFMHRDFQSRNLMVADGRCRVIDFQGGRPGPIQYDLAALLIDPYAELPGRVQERLLDVCIQEMNRSGPVDERRFRRGYAYCRVTRNLQMLGAFGFLTRVKGKTAFADYIPRAAKTLKQSLAAVDDARLGRLRELSHRIGAVVGTRR